MEPEESTVSENPTGSFLHELQGAEDDDDPEKMIRLLGRVFTKVDRWHRRTVTSTSATTEKKTDSSKFYMGSRLLSTRLKEDYFVDPDQKLNVGSIPFEWQGKQRLPIWKQFSERGLTSCILTRSGWEPQRRLQKGYLYVSTKKDLCTVESIRMLATTQHKCVLATMEAQAILNEAFDAVFLKYCIEITCSILRLAALMIVASYRTAGNKDAVGHLVLQAISLTIVCGVTIKDFIHHALLACAIGLTAYFRHNSWQLLINALRAYFMILYIGHLKFCTQSCDSRGETIYGFLSSFEDVRNIVRETLHGILGQWLAMEWLACLWVLRGLRLIGPKMLPVLKATTGAGGFWIVLGFFMAASINYYYVVAPAPIRKSFAESLHAVIKFVFFGDPVDIDASEGEMYAYLANSTTGSSIGTDLISVSEDDPLMRNLRRALTIGAFMNVILMNIFIAMLSNIYEQAMEAAESNFLQQRALIVTHCNAAPWYRRGFNRSGHILVLSPEPSAQLQESAVEEASLTMCREFPGNRRLQSRLSTLLRVSRTSPKGNFIETPVQPEAELPELTKEPDCAMASHMRVMAGMIAAIREQQLSMEGTLLQQGSGALAPQVRVMGGMIAALREQQLSMEVTLPKAVGSVSDV